MLIGKVNGHDITRNPQNILHAADAPSTFYSSACMCTCTQSIIRSQLPVPPLLVQLPTWGNQLVVEFQCVSKGSNPKLITLPLGLTYNFRLNELITFALCVSRPLLSITLWQMDTKDYWTLLKRTRKKKCSLRYLLILTPSATKDVQYICNYSATLSDWSSVHFVFVLAQNKPPWLFASISKIHSVSPKVCSGYFLMLILLSFDLKALLLLLPLDRQSIPMPALLRHS